jgi:altronate dehydratase small subunit
MKEKALVLGCNDNVATALMDLNAGEIIDVSIPQGNVQAICLNEPIPFLHKFALRDIDCNSPIVKSGYSIGRTTRSIRRGDHVHTHNVMDKEA